MERMSCSHGKDDRDGAPIPSRASDLKANLFIVGAAKCGTTSLYRYLGSHPEIYMSAIKEPHHFSSTDVPGSWRRPGIGDQESYDALFRTSEGYQYRGEASTSYLWDPQTPAALWNYNPESRIVILLRDPVERAFSHYLMHVRDGRESRPFANAIADDLIRPPGHYGRDSLYVELGMYSAGVRRFLDQFGHKRVSIIETSNLMNTRSDVLQELVEWLGIPPFASEESFQELYNSHREPRGPLARRVVRSRWAKGLADRLPRSARDWISYQVLQRDAQKPSLDEAVADLLRETYGGDIRELRSFLGVELPSLDSGPAWRR